MDILNNHLEIITSKLNIINQKVNKLESKCEQLEKSEQQKNQQIKNLIKIIQVMDSKIDPNIAIDNGKLEDLMIKICIEKVGELGPKGPR